jgi:hypothetical protein
MRAHLPVLDDGLTDLAAALYTIRIHGHPAGRGHGSEGDDPAQDAAGLDVGVALVDLVE